MTGNYWIARNPGELRARLEAFGRQLEKDNLFPICWQSKKYTSPRTMDQNALYWLWVTEFARFLLDRHKISEREKQDMHYTLQRRCYAATQWEWLISHETDLISGESKVARRSTTKFQKGEMTAYMEWVQIAAADRGLILESQGEYQDLQVAQNA